MSLNLLLLHPPIPDVFCCSELLARATARYFWSANTDPLIAHPPSPSTCCTCFLRSRHQHLADRSLPQELSLFKHRCSPDLSLLDISASLHLTSLSPIPGNTNLSLASCRFSLPSPTTDRVLSSPLQPRRSGAASTCSYPRASSSTGLSTYRISHSPRPLQPSPSSLLQGQRASCRPLDLDYTRSCLVSKFRCPPSPIAIFSQNIDDFFFLGASTTRLPVSLFYPYPSAIDFWIVKSRF